MPGAKRKATRATAKRPSPGVSYDTVVRLGLALPGVEEGLSYGTPALKVEGKLMARLKEDGDTLALRCGFEERQALLRGDPDVFFLTDHYLNYPWVLVRLPRVAPKRLGELLHDAWHRTASRRLLARAGLGAAAVGAAAVAKAAAGAAAVEATEVGTVRPRPAAHATKAKGRRRRRARA